MLTNQITNEDWESKECVNHTHFCILHETNAIYLEDVDNELSR